MLVFVLSVLVTTRLVAAGPVGDGTPSSACTFCGAPAAGTDPFFFDLSSLPNGTYHVTDVGNNTYYVASPCANAKPPALTCCDPTKGATLPATPAVEGFSNSCLELGALDAALSVVRVAADGSGFNVSLPASGDTGSPEPYCNRSSTYRFVCDPTAPIDNPPDGMLVQNPGCVYNIVWRHPAACPIKRPGAKCTNAVPARPQPPSGPADSCLPRWKPTWDMRRSTMIYICNHTGYYDTEKAVRYGVVVIDWSHAEEVWANDKPMSDEEMLTKQAAMIQAVDPGVPGEQQRVWVYRNTIKALPFYKSVRDKLSDPRYQGWFHKFKDYQGPASNHSYHVPACTYAKCSGLYHDQQETPEYPGTFYSCTSECDCGPELPCGEYVFNHANDTFGEWFVHSYMISNETLLRRPLSIGLGWMDDSMTLNGPTEMDKNFVADTGLTAAEMQQQVAAYRANMARLNQAAVEAGGFTYMMITGRGPQVRHLGPSGAAECAAHLRSFCSDSGTSPGAWSTAHNYLVDPTDALANATQYTSEFLLSRGPFAWIGYSWLGCGGTDWPRPDLWDVDFGDPSAPCAESGAGTGLFRRDYAHARVEWDCTLGKGQITMKNGTVYA